MGKRLLFEKGMAQRGFFSANLNQYDDVGEEVAEEGREDGPVHDKETSDVQSPKFCFQYEIFVCLCGHSPSPRSLQKPPRPGYELDIPGRFTKGLHVNQGVQGIANLFKIKRASPHFF